MWYKNKFYTEDEIVVIVEGLCMTIEEHGWKCDDGHYLTDDELSTWSNEMFFEAFETEIYKANGYDIALVQRLLQHSSAAVTQRYIGIEPQRIEEAILNHVDLI